jgi:hypothetical protein
VLRLSMETTPKLDSPLLVGTPMNYAFAFVVNCCVCGFDANYYVDLMLKLCKCLHIAVLHETCLRVLISAIDFAPVKNEFGSLY